MARSLIVRFLPEDFELVNGYPRLMSEENQANFLTELQDIHNDLVAFLIEELGREIRPTRSEWLHALTGTTDFDQGEFPKTQFFVTLDIIHQ